MPAPFRFQLVRDGARALTVVESAGALALVHFGPLTAGEVAAALAPRFGPVAVAPVTEGRRAGALAAAAQLAEYLAGRRRSFTLELAFGAATPFQRRVWAALTRVPFGSTVSYGELARRAGSPGGARAIGGAMGQNPLPLVVPCHRVIRSGGALGGFGGGLPWKRRLLALEGIALPEPPRAAGRRPAP